ncbi:MAG: hypothetical protein M3018_13775 [Actinomycetota bacterium]|nr:hypothetical protein [Actinomycetota bacterium]
MAKDALTSAALLPFHVRVRHGARRSNSWLQFVRQAIAIAAGTPLSFVGQELWSFRA